MTRNEDDYTLNLAHWTQLFALQSRRDQENNSVGSLEIEGGPISTLYDLVLLEQTREEIAQFEDLGESVPTDVFIYGLGEPTRRDVTKIGGLPYRPAEKPWPRTHDGIDYTFIAQFNFSHSHDIVGSTPGEVLLLFAKDNVMANNDSESLIWEWQPANLNCLITHQEIPQPSWEFVTCYGVRHRSLDYRDADEQFGRWISDGACYFGRFEGTKIGGLPGAFYGEADDATKRLLCTVGSVQFAPDKRYPAINHPDCISLKDIHRPELTLTWGDS